jgi:hypothetical protein
MPAKSKPQQRLMAAALHGASFPLAKKVRSSMTISQLADYATVKKPSRPTKPPKP